jgi:GNAT superfamily N-acetyltransferase
MDHTKVRKATAADMASVHQLIAELARYERAENEFELSVNDLLEDGFGTNPIFECMVACDGDQVVGFALFYTKYSTWKGLCLFLEDFIVTQSHRGQGYGAALFQALISIARDRRVKRLEWQVLEWNEPAIQFYQKFGAHLDPEWLNGKLVFQQLQAFPS